MLISALEHSSSVGKPGPAAVDGVSAGAATAGCGGRTLAIGWGTAKGGEVACRPLGRGSTSPGKTKPVVLVRAAGRDSECWLSACCSRSSL